MVECSLQALASVTRGIGASFNDSDSMLALEDNAMISDL